MWSSYHFVAIMALWFCMNLTLNSRYNWSRGSSNQEEMQSTKWFFTKILYINLMHAVVHKGKQLKQCMDKSKFLNKFIIPEVKTWLSGKWQLFDESAFHGGMFTTREIKKLRTNFKMVKSTGSIISWKIAERDSIHSALSLGRVNLFNFTPTFPSGLVHWIEWNGRI